MNNEGIAALERRVRELETCCEKLRFYVEDLDKRKADRVSDRPPVYFHDEELPRFEGSELTGGQRR